jgi:hypothetical protein
MNLLAKAFRRARVRHPRAGISHAVLGVCLLALAACARAGTAAAFPPIERVSDLSPHEFLLRVRALALSDRPSDPAVYEPLLGLTTGGSLVIPGAGTSTELTWRGGDPSVRGQMRVRSSPRQDPSLAEFVFSLPSLAAGPCVTFADLIATFGPLYEVSPHTVPRSGDKRPIPYPLGMPFNAAFKLRTSPPAGATFTHLYPCVQAIQVYADR